MIRSRRSLAPLSVALLFLAWNAPFHTVPANAAGPEGQLTWAVDLPGVITPYMKLKAK